MRMPDQTFDSTANTIAEEKLMREKVRGDNVEKALFTKNRDKGMGKFKTNKDHGDDQGRNSKKDKKNVICYYYRRKRHYATNCWHTPMNKSQKKRENVVDEPPNEEDNIEMAYTISDVTFENHVLISSGKVMPIIIDSGATSHIVSKKNTL
ncbi:hypothetical protein O6H91_06G147500 [Diphasiastrum complanatum]|uniref:Uncharacterized protein n=1 Tax=Diphasiastrum complanatum TaxID=34168 RepID=A0ACC2DKM8_DIPCM|nr:hypothetical protein O6H91_06G147500 [Diphasiastrum complanatum]